MINYLTERNPIRDASGKVYGHTGSLGEEALFDVQIKRIHEYKRQLMNILHILMVYNEIKLNPGCRKVKRMVIIGGKAAPGYAVAKNIIQLIYCVGRMIHDDADVNPYLRVAFLENYNVTKAELLIPASDLSEQISCAGLEASGTGNMKLSMNGSLTIGTEDGANVEMHKEIGDEWWPFSFGLSSDQTADMLAKKSYNPWDIYMHDPEIHQILDLLRTGKLANTESEHRALSSLYHSLLEAEFSKQPDRFFVLKDLRSYYEAQKKVEELFLQPNKWAEYAIQNIAGMGFFSSDQSIHNYAKNIWETRTHGCGASDWYDINKYCC